PGKKNGRYPPWRGAPSCSSSSLFREPDCHRSREPLRGFSVPNDGIDSFGLLASGFLLAGLLRRLLRRLLRSLLCSLLRYFLCSLLRYLLRCFFAFLRHELSPPFWHIRLTRRARMSKHLCAPGKKIFQINLPGM